MTAAIGRPLPAFNTKEEAPPAYVRDQDGNTLELDSKRIGEGGQGAVYRVRHSRYAVKLLDKQEPTASALGDSLQEQLARLRWLPLEGVPISRPIVALAEPDVGYVMDLLDNVVAIETLCEPPDGPLDDWYHQGGGLRRRLRLLARCAAALALLHGRGLVYGDVSPRNVLVSDRVQDHEVWLIDADNVTVESSARGRAVGSYLYKAPEIVREQSGNTPFSDAYSFATLAYQTLVVEHPMIGDLVDQSAQHEIDVQRGLLPWVGHSNDDRNRSRYGWPPSAVLTQRLQALFRQNFERGLNDPHLRPDVGAWTAALHAATDLTMTCANSRCRQTFYAYEPRCPFCEAGRPGAVIVAIHEQLPGRLRMRGTTPMMVEAVSHVVLQAREPFLLKARHSQLVAEQPDAPVARLVWDGDALVKIDNVGGAPLRRVPPVGGAGRLLAPGASVDERLDVAWTLHFGDDHRIHRLLRFHTPSRPGV